MKDDVLSTTAPVSISKLDHNWLLQAKKFAAWVDENGRFPRRQTDDEVERKLGTWYVRMLGQVRNHIDANVSAQARYAWLDAHVPGWKNARRPEAQKKRTVRPPITSIRAMERFAAKHDRMPRRRSDDLAERRLARIIDNARQAKRRGVESSSMMTALNRIYPAWAQ